MNDPRTAFLVQKHLRQKTNHIFAGNKIARVIKQKTAVKIAVPCHPHICPRGDHRLRCYRLIFGQQRIGNTIGKAAVGVMVHPYKFKRRADVRQRCGNGVKCRARRTVACVHQNLHRPQRRKVNKRQHFLHIGVADCPLLPPATLPLGAKIPRLCQCFDRGHPRCCIQRGRSAPHHL